MYSCGVSSRQASPWKTQRKGIIMTRRTVVYCITAIVFLSGNMAVGQWKQIDVGQPGLVTAVAVFGNVTLAGTFAGIFRSTDSGQSWTNVSAVQTNCFGEDGPYLLAGTNGGVLRSTDGGATWSSPDTNMTRQILAFAEEGPYLLAGGGGMFRSTDNGESWTTIENGMGPFQTTVSGIAVDTAGIYVSTFAGLLFSDDSGSTWTNLANVGSGSDFINCVIASDSTVIASPGQGVFRSTNEGKTWTQIGSADIVSFTTHDGDIFAGTETGVIMSTDGGATWAGIDSGLTDRDDFGIAAGNGYLFCGTNSSGVFRASENRLVWQPANNGIVGAQVVSIAGKGPDVFAYMAAFPSGAPLLYISSDNGATWDTDTSVPSQAVPKVAVVDSDVFAFGIRYVYRSSDGGQTWQSIGNAAIDSAYPSAIAGAGGNVVLSCGDSGNVFLSSDQGENWQDITASVPGFTSLASSGSNLFGCGYLHDDYLSTDAGQTWSDVNDTLHFITTVALSGDTLYAGRYQWPWPASSPPNPPGGVFRSTDDGRNWTDITAGLPAPPTSPFSGPQVHTLAIHGNDLFAGLEPGLFYCSTSNDRWINIGSGLPDMQIESMYISDSTIFAGTENGGMWEHPLSTLTAVQTLPYSAVPASFRLLQNYPNPFNPTTTIDYQLPRNAHVTLKVYNVLGQLVTTLVDGDVSAGYHRAIFNGSRFASGVYFYRLTTPTYSRVMKMLMLK